VRDGIAAVGGVQEQDARLAVVVRLAGDQVKEIAGAHRLPDLAVSRVDQVKILVVLHRPHEGVGHTHRDIEVRDMALVGLAGNELSNVRVVDAQHGHVGPAPRATLRDLAESLVVHPQEAHRPGRLAHRGAHQGALGPQPAEGKAVAAARLLDQGRVAQRLEDTRRRAPHVIFNRQHKAGRQLAQRRARPGEGRAVGEEADVRQQLVEAVGPQLDIPGQLRFGAGHMAGHPPEHLMLGLGRLAIRAAPQVTLGQDSAGILGERQMAQRQCWAGMPVRPAPGFDLA